MNYIKSFWKYYLPKRPKLILTIILSLFVYFWLINIINEISDRDLNFSYLGAHRSGIYFIFIKPVFVYISGLIIINKI